MAVHNFEGVGGAKIAADIVGTGRPVVMLHGAGQTRGSWWRTAAMFADQGYRAITLDARGHGESAWSPEGYGMDVFVGDLRAVLDQVEGRPALIGASLGGLTSMVAIGEAAHAIASALVLVDITPHIKREGGSAIQGFMGANPEGFATVEEAADAVSRYLPHRPRPKSVEGLRRNLREREDGRLVWHWDPAFINPRPGHRPDIDAMQARLDDAARAIDVPTLMVRGSDSEIVSDEGVEQFRRLVPTAEIVEVSGARHMVAGDANTDFAGATIEFLSRVYPA
ncbi:alpha/beta fold hydrolase [Sphingomonas montanisoli]|uniref:Alpha/beta hydrolase n=1 Tax=Sphingomonas montanisoli TaxID=2606412 RepID=A0A5D9C0B8_9SPHN|nr:alpha/beta hydrolase [Sphingomonas montanisoli]TZG24712.1 alpha/beta hydrolase [Sphingomonas montanisoli]